MRQLDDAVNMVKFSEERRREYMRLMDHDMEIREVGKILGTVETMRDDGKDDQTIIARLIKKYGLSQSEAEEYVLADAVSI